MAILELKEILLQRLARGVLEFSCAAYRNPMFLVKKKDGKHRLINAAIYINKVTIRDANLPLVVDEFVERYAGSAMVSIIDLHSSYDQVPLDEGSRDLISF
jgi:hypothetical protein